MEGGSGGGGGGVAAGSSLLRCSSLYFSPPPCYESCNYKKFKLVVVLVLLCTRSECCVSTLLRERRDATRNRLVLSSLLSLPPEACISGGPSLTMAEYLTDVHVSHRRPEGVL